LRLDLSSKEIAAITNQSIGGVETARTRLRKKLNLSNSTISTADYLKKY
jgi:DNA-binding CsgD family transcriptional regulator